MVFDQMFFDDRRAYPLDYPLHVDGYGATAATSPEDHIRDMIEQLLLTSPGERVNRPDFGSGLLDLVFAPASAELAAALQFSLQAALQRWLGDVIDVARLVVAVEEATVAVAVSYTVLATGEARTEVIERTGPA
ncbi:GPW/gp25 family protein [Frankia sp. Cas4]|uniref:GPW/gp25 family protein n=1 Tax=Frankia sp. Cas4 TaxID=3073927 RepID=UPI002AD44DD3|nr:GPW/gp25 family protein [Frankia sp. Cas4]